MLWAGSQTPHQETQSPCEGPDCDDVSRASSCRKSWRETVVTATCGLGTAAAASCLGWVAPAAGMFKTSISNRTRQSSRL
jgi:hypothetical protein